MAQDPDLQPPPDTAPSVQATKPDKQEVDDPYSGDQYEPPLDKKYWLRCLEDAERAEQDWRRRGRQIVEIYRNEAKNARSKTSTGQVTYNILYANTEVMLPAVYQKPPKPVVRSRFTSVKPPPQIGMPPLPPGMPPPGPPGGLGPSLPGGPAMGPPAGAAPPPGPVPPVEPPPGGAPLSSAPPAPLAGPAPGMAGPAGGPPMTPPGPPLPPEADLIGGPPPFAAAPPPLIPPPPGVPPPSMPPPMGPPKPDPADIDTAASVMQKALEIVLDDENSSEAVKFAIKDVLLPGRGTCRVRWRPQMASKPVMAGDGTTPLPHPETGEPVTQDVKVWEQVLDEYVFWEDLLVDPVRAAPDTDWIAFRHLFTKEGLEAEFAGSPEYEQLKTLGKLDSILRWTDESAAKSPVGGGSAMKSSRNLGDYVRKAMVWEIWHRPTKRVIWFIREISGLMLRIDPDVYALDGFYPTPMPMLAVTTTDSRIPRPYYDLYDKLASDLDETSVRISRLTKHIKARGAYNSASTEIQDLLTADDNKMIPVTGVDMLNGGLANHIWMMPIEIFVSALTQLYIARDQIKQAIYEIMGISDIMRGATKATETATAQRIKGSMGVSRLEDQKQGASTFVRDLLRLKGELIAQNFDPETLEKMTGETVTPEVMAILRDDFQRTCLIDIESDSTVVPDLQAEQEGMAMVMQSVQLVMQGTQAMLMTGILPPPLVLQLGLELLKMALHPVRYSRGVVELIDSFQQQLMQMPPQAMMPPPPPPPGAPGPGAPPPSGVAKPPGQEAAKPPHIPGGPLPGNGAAPPGFM